MTRTTLDPDNLPIHRDRTGPPGHTVRSIGPSDDMDENSDRYGTGERMAAGQEPSVEPGADIGFDRIVGADEAGLGDGLDQAEEAQLGVTDEEIDEALGRNRDD